MMVLRRQRHRDPSGPSPWSDELRRLDGLLGANPDHEWAWLWQLRRRILRFLDARYRDRPRAAVPWPRAWARAWARAWRRPGRERPRGPRRPRTDPATPVEQRFASPIREPRPVPPEVKHRIHDRLTDLAGMNEGRYVGVGRATRIAEERDRVRVRLWMAGWRLDRMVSPPGRVHERARVAPPSMTIDRIHRRLSGELLRACPFCLRPRRFSGEESCINCGYRFAGHRVTWDDIVTALATVLEFDPATIVPRDRLIDLARRPGPVSDSGS